MKNKNKLTSAVIGLAALLGSLASVNLVQASAVYGSTCNLMVYPYNPAAASDTLGGAAIPYVNQLNSTNCDTHLKYTKSSSTPSAYTPQPPPNTDDVNSGTPLSSTAGTGDKRVPWAHHDHEYFNDKTQDVGFFYKSFMDQFEITIQKDGNDNLDLGWGLSNIKCWTAVPSDYVGDASDLSDCSGSASDLYGGTVVSKTDNGNTITILWKFAQTSPNVGRPQLMGNNGVFDSYKKVGSSYVAQFLGLNTSNPYNRGALFGVEIKSANNSDPVWSATTTSRALVADLSMRKASYNADHKNTAEGCAVPASPGDPSNVGWCYLTPSGYPTQTVMSNGTARTFYWYPIGSVATVWKKPAPPPPASCTDLQVTPSALNSSGATPMTAKVIISDGTVHTANLLWTPTGGNMSAGNTQSGSTAPSIFNNTFNLTGASGSVKVKVTSISDGVTLGTCANDKEVKTPPPPPVCTGITLTPDPLDPNAVNNMKAHVTFSDGSTQTATVGWTGFGGTLAKTTDTHLTNTDFTNTFTVTDKSNAGVTAKVTSVVGPALNSPVCMAGKEVKVPPPYCLNITLNKTTISNTGSDTVDAKVNYSDGIERPTTVTWAPTNLTLAPPINPLTQNSSIHFVKVTTPVVSGNPVNLNVAVTGVPAGVLNSLACSGGVNASSGGAQCLSLQNSGYTGTTVPGGAYVLFAPNPINTDSTHPAQVTWTETGNGILTRNNFAPWPYNTDAYCPLTIDNEIKNLPNGCQYFYSTPSTPGTNGSVTITANPNNGNVAACTQTTSFNNVPQNNLCTGLTWALQPSGQTCVTPIGPVASGTYQWTIGAGAPFNNGTCQTIPPNTSVHVQAVGESVACSVNIPPQNNQCNYVTPNYNGTDVCLTVNGTYNGPFTWYIDSKPPIVNGLCQPVPPNTTVKVVGPTNACSLNNYVTPPNPPRLQKTVRAMNPPESSQGEHGGSNPLTLVPATGTGIDGKIVEYKITFTPTSPNTTATIVDDMSKGYIQGVTNTGANGGTIQYYDHQDVSVPLCSSTIKTNCYSGEIGSGGLTLTKVSSAVTITYEGLVKDNVLTDANCKDNNSTICQERFPNTATSNYTVYDSTDTPVTTGTLSAVALVQSFCQYILTRAAGDIYLETDLNFGKNIELCSQYRSSTGLIVTPGPPPSNIAPSTGPGTVPIGHEICNTGFSVNLQGTGSETLYGQTVAPNLSSQICEVKLRPGESWSKSTITSTIQENKTRVSRWTPNLDSTSGQFFNLDDNALGVSNTGVYHITNKDLVIGGGGDIVYPDGAGAKTFIVEGHNLIIKNNIKYGACNKPSGVCTVRDTASLAFIVLGGNVLIDKDVTDVSGVFFVQQGAAGSDSGKIKSLNGDSYNKITFFGSIYGDIQDLFTAHKFAGDPAANQGSVVIRFDERIILNTPPVLKDVLQLSENQVAR